MNDDGDFYTSPACDDALNTLHTVMHRAASDEDEHKVLIYHLRRAYGALANERNRRDARAFSQVHGALSTRQLSLAKKTLAQAAFGSGAAANVAAVLAMSPGHFCHLFKASTGQSVHRWVTGLRMERAKSLLLGTSMSVASVAQACGYKGQCHFSRIFTRETGIGPGQWRRMFHYGENPTRSRDP